MVAAMLTIAGVALAAAIGEIFPIIWAVASIFMTRVDIAGMAQTLKAETSAGFARAELRMMVVGFALVCIFVVMPTELLLSFEYNMVMAAMALFAAGATRSASMFAISRRIGATYFAPYVLFPTTAMAWDAANSTDRTVGSHFIGLVALCCCLAYMWKSWSTRNDAETALDAALLDAEQRRDQAARDAAVSRLLFQHTLLRAALFDRDGRFITVNAAWLGAVQKTEADLLGKTIAEAMPLAKSDWSVAIAAALQGETKRVNADKTTRVDGVEVYLDWQVQPWYNDDGSIGGAVGYAQDMTEVHVSRKAALAKQERLSLALEANKSFIWEVDYLNKSVSFDEAATAFFGKELTFEMVSTEAYSAVHPDDKDANTRQLKKILKSGGHGRMEARNILADGSIRWVRSDIAPKTITNGVATSFVLMTSDITEEMARQEQLASMMERANAALGEKRKLLEELCGETSLISFAGTALEDTRVVLRAGEANESAFTQLFASFDQILTEIDDRDTALAAAVQQLRDARTSAESANIAKSQFLANMSHELRTPLNAIIGYTEILIEDAEYEGRGDAAKDANKVRTSATHLLKLINEILDLSKIEAGKMDITREPTPLTDVFSDILASAEPLAAANNNRVSVEVDCDRTLALTDGFRLRQCMLNLVSNACKFTENGEIVIGLHIVDTDDGQRWFDISIKDSGIGISHEQIDRLFRPFSQADGSTTRKYGGTGLGLALTREMTQLLGGEVIVESEVGVGSTFTLRIPSVGLEAGDVDTIIAPDTTSALVLVVDDDPVARTLTSRAAVSLGMSVAAAETGRAALAFCDENDVGLIVLDLQLPDMDGFDVLAALRGAEKTRNTPVMVVSVDDDRRKSISSGAQEHLAKPCPSAVLTAAMARLARRQPLQEAILASLQKTEAQNQTMPSVKTKRSA
jgi:PAS domain S-box-containing protein